MRRLGLGGDEADATSRLRRYLCAIFSSSIGAWIHGVSNAWLILELGGGGVEVAAVTAAQFAPLLLLGLLTGALADRRSRSRILGLAQLTMATSAIVVSGAIWFDLATTGLVIGAAFLAGIAIAFDGPARLSYIGDLAPPDLLARAVALNTVAFNSARLVGPAIAGAAIASMGTAAAFALAAGGYLSAAALLLGIVGPPRTPVSDDPPRVKAGLQYAWSAGRRRILVSVAIVGAVALNFTVTLSVLVRDRFSTGPSELGWLFSSMGAGSLLGGVWLARRRGQPLARTTVVAACTLASGMTALAIAPTMPTALMAASVCGAGATVFLASSNTALQLASDPTYRGRVMAVYLVVYMGSTPAGALPIGWIAERWSAGASLFIGAAAAVVAAVLIAAIPPPQAGGHTREEARRPPSSLRTSRRA